MLFARRLFWIALWTALVGLSLYFAVTTVLDYVYGYVPANFKLGFFTSKIWFIVHIGGSTASLLLGPLQFWSRFRTRNMKYHRIAGKIFIIGSLIGAIGAFRLNLMYDCVACRYSLGILSILWFFFTAAAWWAIKNKNVKAHRQFMTRSYAAALAFVFIRLPSLFGGVDTLPFVTDQMQVRITYEWFCWILPLIAIEMYMVWWPSLAAGNRKASAK
jgi:uncharacterized membrane protein